MRLTETQRIEILIMLGCGEKTRTHNEVRIMFNNKYPNREPVSQSTISRIEAKWRETGTVKDLGKPGRPGVPNDKKLDILVSLTENPNLLTTQLGLDNTVHRSTVTKFLKKEKWHPYKIQLLQELIEDDPDRRNEFCQTMTERTDNNPRLVKQICFSDEATFCLNGEVNRHNFRYWAPANPHWFRESHSQYNEKVNVWAGIINNRVIGPYFFEGSLTGERYHDFLATDLIPALATLYPDENMPDMPNQALWFQQDGAPPHYAAIVRRFLDDVFPNRWIGRRGPIEWPPRSPDLNPLDYFLWGYVKNVVYKDKPRTLDILKDRIRNVIRNISPETVENVQQEFIDRLGYCRAVNGGHFQHLIK